MQAGWNETQTPPVAGITDPWTENNAADYLITWEPLIGNSWALSNESNAAYVRVGTKSIKIAPDGILWFPNSVTWRIRFPAAGTGIIWPAQPPWNMLNSSNEEAMSETMGEMSSIDFWAKVNTGGTISVSATDYLGMIAVGPTLHLTPIGFHTHAPYVSEWGHYVAPFGPASGWKIITAGTPPPAFHWDAIEYLNFSFTLDPWVDGSYPIIYFDGLKIIKPLIANASYVSTDSYEKTRRDLVIPKEKIVDYQTARLIAKALLEEQKRPNVYWNFENIGRTDIPSGYLFKIGATELLMRDQRWGMSKEGGWLVTATAQEKT